MRIIYSIIFFIGFLNFTQYYIHGLFELLYLIENFQEKSAMGLINFGIIVKFFNVVGLDINNNFEMANEEDWSTEYLDKIISIKIVDGVEGAIDHINNYSSNHTESIITEDLAQAEFFINSVGSSAIMHNTSTRFNDGNELGLGAEIGISTTKLHAFGPMGLNELTSKKFVVIGDGQTK